MKLEILWIYNQFGNNRKDSWKSEDIGKIIFGLVEIQNSYENSENNEIDYDEDFENLSDEIKSKIDKFLEGFLELMIIEVVKYSVFTKILKLIKSTLSINVPQSHQTIFNRSLSNYSSYNYYIRCDCGEILIFIKGTNEIQCTNLECRKTINLKEYSNNSPKTVSFSMKEL